MREVVDDCEFKTGEKITFFRQYGERFIVRGSFNKNKIMREQNFETHREAESFYDSFIEGKDIRKWLNQMLEEINKEGKYKTVLL